MATARKLNLKQTDQSMPDIRKSYPEFRNILLHRRNDILRREQHERAQFDEQVMTDPGDVGDLSVIDTSADYFFKLADGHRRELVEIDNAFDRMQRGTFGVCESCESDVPIERLRKMPYARFCLDCQSEREAEANSRRPHRFPTL